MIRKTQLQSTITKVEIIDENYMNDSIAGTRPSFISDLGSQPFSFAGQQRHRKEKKGKRINKADLLPFVPTGKPQG